MKAIIFGANGQDGFYLCAHLRERGIEAIGFFRAGAWLHADVADFSQVEPLVRMHRPDYIFHLAANSTTRHDALFQNHATIATGALNVLEAARQYAPCAKVFLSGSGLQFVNRGEPISELDPFDANSPYSLARIHSAYAARYYRGMGIRAYVGYLFHHESPLRKLHHVSQKIAQAAKRIANGSGERLEMGDISVKKEWAFAGDVVRGILSLVSQDEVFEAVIGTGVAYSIENWLERCFQNVGLDWGDHTSVRSDFVPEYPCLVSAPALIHSLGWRPEVDFATLAKKMVYDE